jgi:hypothetical protein
MRGNRQIALLEIQLFEALPEDEGQIHALLLDLTKDDYTASDNGRFRLTIQANLLKLVKKLSALPLLPGYLNRFRSSESKYMWAIGFLVISVLFNPALPVPMNHRIYPGLEWLSIGAFLVSLAAIRSESRLSVPLITGRTPGSESL